MWSSDITWAACRYTTPPGHGFLPRQTAMHHQARIELLCGRLWLRSTEH